MVFRLPELIRNSAPARANRFLRSVLIAAERDRACAEVSDRVHEFMVEIRHDGERVVAVDAEARRVPWTTCPGAIPLLRQFVGFPIGIRGGTGIDQAQHCTHMLDLARLAIAHGGETLRRRYEMEVEAGPDAIVTARLHRDGALLLDWRLKGSVVVSPPSFAGHDTEVRSSWSPEVAADPDLVEAALLLRRSVWVHKRLPFSSDIQHATGMKHMEGACYSFQPGRIEQGRRPANFEDRS
jgi:hypothetical protein